MKKLAIGAALTGALALTGLAAPVASAATPSLVFSGVTVNKGKAIVVGTTGTVNVPVTYNLTRPADLVIDNKKTFAAVVLYRGSLKSVDNELGPEVMPTCTTTATTATTVTQRCTETIPVSPRDYLYEAADAGTWKAAGVYAHMDSTVSDDFLSSETNMAMWGNLTTAKVQRAAKLTTDATPEPVKKGKTLTVKGALTRANWANGKYSGYVGQTATLQFRAKGSSTYKNVKTVKSGTAGALSTTVKANADGYYRYTFAGTSTTAAATAAGDYVDVK
ncbi:hypothetical protein FNH09_36030 [Streptomyces adustus]|uniref:Calcium-binding protein n=1 Tax=Streptomyces adustus TaxID=1609272 RepID=A0A5N8VMF7_9ACTN|nr:hypothetical protein [Streptomyces adustus]MPY36440.1 hypothetical protein [Streptomyces adustus]